jgi:hypothetical protein
MARSVLHAPLLAFLAACASGSEPPATGTAALPPDRPLGGMHRDAAAERSAALVEAALASVSAADLRRCVGDSRRGAGARLAPPAGGGWLIVASAIPADGEAFRRRHEAAPALNPEPADGWHDRVTYRGLSRGPDGEAAACLSCVFDYEEAVLVYRHAYALDTCRRAVPPERDLATVVWLE